MDPKLLIGAIAVLLFVMVLLFGNRLRENYGSITPREEVTRHFEQYDKIEDHDYYIAGQDEYPTAIIGISREFSLKSDLWKKKVFEEGEFKRLVMNMRNLAMSSELELHGFEIRDKENRYVGVWYSIIGFHAVVRSVGERGIVIDPPDEATERRYHGGSA